MEAAPYFVVFSKSGRPWKFFRDMPDPPEFVPIECQVELLRQNEDGSLDVCTKESLMLSNGCGATLPLRHYRLKTDGTVEYFYFETYGKQMTKEEYWETVKFSPTEKWWMNVPTWKWKVSLFCFFSFFKDFDKEWHQEVRRSCLIVMWMHKQDGLFRRLPKDVVKLIAKEYILPTVTDRIWFFAKYVESINTTSYDSMCLY